MKQNIVLDLPLKKEWYEMIEDYCIEHIIDEPKVNDIYKIDGTLVMYGDDVTFEIEEYYEEEEKTI